jgi:hypothetical protein
MLDPESKRRVEKKPKKSNDKGQKACQNWQRCWVPIDAIELAQEDIGCHAQPQGSIRSTNNAAQMVVLGNRVGHHLERNSELESER